MSDMLFSFQVGLPSMVRSLDYDTRPPLNIYDEEIDEDTEMLPPSRPPSQFTPNSYMLAKAMISVTFGKIVEATSTILAGPYEEITKLDQDLRTVYHELPSILQVKSIEDSISDPINTLTMRYNISMLYHKSQCVLHRRYLTKARENERYRDSRRACVDSSMALLRYQATFHYEARPGGRLRGMRWYDFSLTSSVFLLAATLVSLDLWSSAQLEVAGRPSDDTDIWGSSRVEELTKALSTSRDIWNEVKINSLEAYKAYEIIGVMLTKIQSVVQQSAAVQGGPAPAQQSTYPYPSATATQDPKGPAFASGDEEKPEHTAAMTLGMLSSGAMGQNAAAGAGQPQVGQFNGSYLTAPGAGATNETPNATGLTPGGNTEAQGQQGAASTGSPYNFFGSDMPPANIDWVSTNDPNILDGPEFLSLPSPDFLLRWTTVTEG